MGCLCGERIKIIRQIRWVEKLQRKIEDECLRDDNDCKQHIKCLKKNIGNELNGTKKDKIAIYKFLNVFQETIYKRYYGRGLTEEEAEIEKGYLHLLEDWGPYGPPTSSTCGGPAGALRASAAVLYTMGAFGPPLRAVPCGTTA